ncbi:MAG: hypothetical protein GDA36_10545 [Rhodobacteraceae bacterium]|nr:hypothetical protein [Paracoccaceae bacterium]
MTYKDKLDENLEEMAKVFANLEEERKAIENALKNTGLNETTRKAIESAIKIPGLEQITQLNKSLEIEHKRLQEIVQAMLGTEDNPTTGGST